jgi:hypothetical protein
MLRLELVNGFLAEATQRDVDKMERAILRALSICTSGGPFYGYVQYYPLIDGLTKP